jgi:ABC-type multidrug transport system fused ATPase/permease subunit
MIRLRVQSEERIDSSKLGGWERFRLFLRLQRFVMPVWDKLLARLLCTQAAGMLVLVPPLLSVQLMDEILPQGDVAGLVRVVLVALCAITLSHVLLYIGGIPSNFSTAWITPESVLGNYMIARIGLDMKMRFYRHLQKLSVRFFGGRAIGEHMYRATADVDESALLASESVPLIVSVVQRVIMTSYLLAQLGTRLVVFVMLYLVVFFWVKQALITVYRRMDRRQREAGSRMEAVTREILASEKVIKGYDRGRTARRWYAGRAQQWVKWFMRRELFMYFDLHFSGNLFATVTPVFSMYFGALVLSGGSTLGEYTAAGGLMYLLLTPLQESISLYQLARQRLVPVERMIETLDVKPDVTDPIGALSPRTIEGHIELRNVRFGYKPDMPVLDGVSLTVMPGEKVAIVGGIGAGKTTLTSLLLRLYDPDEGQVLIDGRDVREYRQESLRRHIGIVTQQVNTFTESIRRNILYGKPLASDAEMLEAARLAFVDEFAVPLPGGYDTVLEEGGSLSGGQKQRICISRALVRDPRILILDEATSALDPVTEKRVIENIDRAFAARTRIIVAHNLLSAKTADRIYVLAAGMVVESGTHEELMKAGGAYANLWTAEHDEGEIPA